MLVSSIRLYIGKTNYANANALSRLPAFCNGADLGQEPPASEMTGKDILKMCAVQEILSSLERKEEGR